MTSPWRQLPGTSPKTLDQLAPDTCHWPIGEDSPYTFCSAPIPAHPDDRPQIYCAAHALIAYKPKPVIQVNRVLKYVDKFTPRKTDS